MSARLRKTANSLYVKEDPNIWRGLSNKETEMKGKKT